MKFIVNSTHCIKVYKFIRIVLRTLMRPKLPPRRTWRMRMNLCESTHVGEADGGIQQMLKLMGNIGCGSNRKQYQEKKKKD